MDGYALVSVIVNAIAVLVQGTKAFVYCKGVVESYAMCVSCTRQVVANSLGTANMCLACFPYSDRFGSDLFCLIVWNQNSHSCFDKSWSFYSVLVTYAWTA